MTDQKECSFAKYAKTLNDPEPVKRLANLQALVDKGGLESGEQQPLDYYINNHIHTTFSFSSYSPAMAVWMSCLAGLQTAGIVDHDTVAGVREFMRAGAITGLPVTKGIECRVDFSETPLSGLRINNPDQLSNAYIALHGIPDRSLDNIAAFFAPYREERQKRNRLMVGALNRLLGAFGITLDYAADILPLSNAAQGGAVTERHILFGLAHKLMGCYAPGAEIIRFLEEGLRLPVAGRNRTFLTDNANPFYAYDLLNLLKSSLVEKFYIPATTECPDVRQVLALAESSGAISAYAYLGDVGESVTGDKKPQAFEDAYLDQLLPLLKELGFRAVTYMPARNSSTQLARLRKLCNQYDLFQICGEDINSPRQAFVCEALRDKELHNLVDAAWALIGHEQRSNGDLAAGFFAPAIIDRYPRLDERVQVFKEIAQQGRVG